MARGVKLRKKKQGGKRKIEEVETDSSTEKTRKTEKEKERRRERVK